MPLVALPTDEEKKLILDETRDIYQFMKALMNREMRVSGLLPKILELTATEKLMNSDDRHPMLRRVLGTPDILLTNNVELCWMIGVNSRLNVVFVDLLSIGNNVSAQLSINECFRSFFAYAAVAGYFVHTHPSGHLEPSDGDLKVTRNLIEAGTILGIPIIEHIIISKNDAYGMRDQGDIEKIKKTIKDDKEERQLLQAENRLLKEAYEEQRDELIEQDERIKELEEKLEKLLGKKNA